MNRIEISLVLLVFAIALGLGLIVVAPSPKPVTEPQTIPVYATQVLECPVPDLSNMQPGDTMTVRCEVKK